jgi:phosphoribosylanthranilate isomerase
MMKVKVCGITRYEDARTAIDAGAWALGFIFHPSSPRAVSPDQAREIVNRLPGGTRSIGVFVDRSAEEVQEVVDHVGLVGAQLQGDESPETLDAVRADPRVKAFRVGRPTHEGGGEEDVTDLEERIAEYPGALILLDTYRKDAHGGTGETFDWNIARQVATKRSLVLAGGLKPENIVAAAQTVQPFALDVSSGLEASQGIKDPARIRELFDALAAYRSDD